MSLLHILHIWHYEYFSMPDKNVEDIAIEECSNQSENTVVYPGFVIPGSLLSPLAEVEISIYLISLFHHIIVTRSSIWSPDHVYQVNSYHPTTHPPPTTSTIYFHLSWTLSMFFLVYFNIKLFESAVWSKDRTIKTTHQHWGRIMTGRERGGLSVWVWNKRFLLKLVQMSTST